MAGKQNLSSFAGSEGTGISGEDLEFGDFFDQEEEDGQPSDDDVRAQAAPEEPEVSGEEDDEEQSGADDDSDEEMEYEEEDEDDGEEGDDDSAPPAPAPAAAATLNPQSPQPDASGTKAQPKPQALHELLRQNQDVVVKALAENEFKLPKEEAEFFDDPNLVGFIERNNARNYVQTLASVSQWLHAALPTVIANFQSMDHNVRAAEQEFYTEYPDLKDIPSDQLAKVGNFVAQQGKQLNRQQLKAEIARIARSVYKNGAAPAKKANGKKSAAKPKTVSRMPFSPANRGAAAKPAGKGKQKAVDPLGAVNAMLLAGDFED